MICLTKEACRAFPRFLLFAAFVSVLQHTWNTDRDIGFSQRQTLIADTGLLHPTLMASTMSFRGAQDLEVGVGDCTGALGGDALKDAIQLIRMALRPTAGMLPTQVDRCPTAVLQLCGASFPSTAVQESQPLTPSAGSTPEGVSLAPGPIITTATGTDKTQTCPRGLPNPPGLAGSESLHSHIHGDLTSFPSTVSAGGDLSIQHRYAFFAF